jgi:hypothetical protein
MRALYRERLYTVCRNQAREAGRTRGASLGRQRLEENLGAVHLHSRMGTERSRSAPLFSCCGCSLVSEPACTEGAGAVSMWPQLAQLLSKSERMRTRSREQMQPHLRGCSVHHPAAPILDHTVRTYRQKYSAYLRGCSVHRPADSLPSIVNAAAAVAGRQHHQLLSALSTERWSIPRHPTAGCTLQRGRHCLHC